MRRVLRALMFLALMAFPATAQDTATLVADRVSVSGNSTLVAEGGVQVFYRGQSLRATRIEYDRVTDRLVIEGPLALSDGKGTLLLASQADLGADLADGVLTSARLVLNRQLQVAANQIFRSGGRYTELSNTVASSCQVCASNPTPLWEIRARRVVHDQAAQQLYFEQATLRLAGLPVFYLPRLRMPDPTLDRADGFLAPRLRTRSNLGTGVQVPYFKTLGPSRDLTVSPYFTTKGTRSVDWRYRQALDFGAFEVAGAVSRDRLRPGETRGYVLATGAFGLPQGFTLGVRVERVSDDAYFLDYGITEKDRLDSRIEASRTRRNEYISARLVSFQSIRAGEDNATLPSLLGDLTFHRRFSGGPIGGEAGFRFQTHSHDRRSDDPQDFDGDGQADGRDLSRASVRVDWRRNWILPAGMIGSALAEATADIYSVQQDAVFQGNTTRFDGAAAVELRWPWVRAEAGGASHVVEPVVQIVANSRTDADVPNEDSTLVEFDEGNLFALGRFAGSDARERGVRANVGISWTRYDPLGWSLGATMGRVVRADDLRQFGPSSGLDGKLSDWLLAVQVGLPDGVLMTNRLILDDDFDLSKAEMRLDLSRERYGLSSSYVMVQADPQENRPKRTQELVFDGRYTLAGNWTGKATGRYDFVANRAASAGVGVEFRNECLLVDLSLSRRFTSSTTVRPTTDFGLQVDLLGFGGAGKAGPARTCRR